MLGRLALPLTAAALCFATTATAQQPLTLPKGFDFVPGPNVYTYPFGRDTGALQLLIDGDQVSSGVALLNGISFRTDNVASNRTAPEYTKNYRVTAYTVAQVAANMAADPASNIGGATGTVLFDGPMTLPPVTELEIAPGTFNITIPFNSNYIFNPTNGNLLFVIETTDNVPTNSGTYRIDAVVLRDDRVEGVVEEIEAAGCTRFGRSVTLSADEDFVYLGNTASIQISTSDPAAIPLVAVGYGFNRTDVPLLPLGFAFDCVLRTNPDAVFFSFQSGGAYPDLQFPLPTNSSLEGTAAVIQGVGITAGGPSQWPVSNTLGARVGGANPPLQKIMSSFQNTSGGWFIGSVGTFVPVFRLEGFIP